MLAASLERGGPVEQAIVLAHGLARQGATVRAACASAGLAERFAAAGAEPDIVPARHWGDLSSARRLHRLARGADVVHAHDRRTGLWVRLGPRPRRGGLRVYTAHGIPFEYHPPPVGKDRHGLRAVVAYRGLDAGLAWRADAVVVPSRAVADDLVGRLGYPRRRIVVIPNGILPAVAPGVRGDLVGTLSVLEPFKGLDVFLRAAAVLAAGRPQLRFVVYGTGSEEARVARLSEELGLSGRLTRPGHVPAAQALASLGIYVLSSYWENAPMALLEAMDAGVPIVATRVGGVPEILSEGTAQLVEAGDHQGLAQAIARLLDDPERRAAQVEAARERVRRDFSAEANARATLALYERLLSRSVTGSARRGSKLATVGGP